MQAKYQYGFFTYHERNIGFSWKHRAVGVGESWCKDKSVVGQEDLGAQDRSGRTFVAMWIFITTVHDDESIGCKLERFTEGLELGDEDEWRGIREK